MAETLSNRPNAASQTATTGAATVTQPLPTGAPGLASRVVPLDQLMDEAVKTAEKIAALSLPITMIAKEAVNRAFETSLAEGVLFERRTFHATFATRDKFEGMDAFANKRKPNFEHR